MSNPVSIMIAGSTVSLDTYFECYEQLLEEDQVEPDNLEGDHSEVWNVVQNLEEKGYAERVEGRLYDIEDFGEEEHLDYMESQDWLVGDVDEDEKEVLAELERSPGLRIEQLKDELGSTYGGAKDVIDSLSRKSMVVSGPNLEYEASPETI